MLRPWLSCMCLAFCGTLEAQQRPLPVIDMHMHALPAAYFGPPPAKMCAPFAFSPSVVRGADWSGEGSVPQCDAPIWSPMTDDSLRDRTLAILEQRNVIGVTSGPFPYVQRWRQAAPERIIPGILFSVASDPVSTDSLRAWHARGELAVMGEVGNQYDGISASDSVFEPYLALAEELDMPVGIHIGTGPPGAPYLGAPSYRARLHSALQLEEALIRHPRLRLYVMHAGWPMLDDMLAVLYAYPQVFIDVGVIVYGLPEVEFYRYLRTIVEAGFGKRVMFGSDQMVWPETLSRGIEIIEKAPFLTEDQKQRHPVQQCRTFSGLERRGYRTAPWPLSALEAAAYASEMGHLSHEGARQALSIG